MSVCSICQTPTKLNCSGCKQIYCSSVCSNTLYHEAYHNKDPKKQIFSHPNMEMYIEYLKPNNDLGMERHGKGITQFFHIVRGYGNATVGETTFPLGANSIVIVPPMVNHNIRATNEGLWFYTLYSGHPQ